MHIHIPQPCSESWDAMQPAASGRHCAQCDKTVIDFTGMSAEEIGLYLQLNAGQSVCGRFHQRQLSDELPTPNEAVLYIVRAPWAFLKQVAAIILFALFLTATPAVSDARQKIKSKASQKPEQPLAGAIAIVGEVATPPIDTPRYQAPVIMGRMPVHHSTDTAAHKSRRQEDMIKGKIAPLRK